MIKACIFDLDGTLLDTIPTISHYCNLSLEEFGLGTIEDEEYKYLVGNGAKVLIERALDFVGADKEEYFEKVYKFYTKAYDKDVSYGTKPYDGIPEMLAELKTMGIRTYVLSNKPDFAANEAIKTFLGNLIDATYGGRDGVALKPSTEGVDIVLSENGIKREECLYIGDTSVDMQTGKNALMYTIGVLWGFRKRDELEANGADAIVSQASEIVAIAKEK
ncbi:MAG: HAD family hydrolase [Clostridia bacterium]|nr:HAD family hydrolase [Clostridia bacterium]